TYWIVGHPHETEKDFQETLDFLKDNGNYIYEVDLALFYFYGDGELGKDTFIQQFGGVVERFPPIFEKVSVFRYHNLKDLSPSREEAYDRVIRFVQAMKELGIPCNRSSVADFMVAERRWQRRKK
ncbi:MAG: hypothetical protein JXQ83_03095, partial [Candidatus Glassbacteria bacterium]|nr:hypothetical protein [Candidatus Glassbacteria bacterium]